MWAPASASEAGPTASDGAEAIRVHPRAALVVGRYLALVDAALPGLVTGMHLVGSAVLDDFQPGVSDVNFVAVISEGLTEDVSGKLDEVHRRLASKHPACLMDGVYVDLAALEGPAAWATGGPHVRAGAFSPNGTHGRRVADRHALATSGEALRGSTIAALALRSDVCALDADIAERAGDALARALVPVATPETVSNLVLEVARLHYALVTGKPSSKSKAALYGLIAFPSSYRRVLDESLRVRRNTGAASSYDDLRGYSEDAFEFAGMAAEDIRDLATVTGRR